MDTDFDFTDVDLSEYVEDSDKGRKILRLEYPLEIIIEDSTGTVIEEVKHIEFRRPVGRDLDLLDSLADGKSVMNGARKFVSALVYGDSRITQRKLEELDAEDVMRSMAVCFGFFQKPSRKTSGQ